MTRTENIAALASQIDADADENIRIPCTRERDAIVVAVEPDEDEDDCISAACDLVARLYDGARGVSSVTAIGWEDEQRCRVLVRIGVGPA